MGSGNAIDEEGGTGHVAKLPGHQPPISTHTFCALGLRARCGFLLFVWVVAVVAAPGRLAPAFSQL